MAAALGDPIGGPTVVANGVVYVVTDPAIGDSHIFGLAVATGRVLFDARLSGFEAMPTVADGTVVVSVATGDVVSYEGPDT